MMFEKKDVSGCEYGNGYRYQVVQHCIDSIGAKSYLEIGCSENDCFDVIKCDTKVGVDPVRGGTVRSTSDEFFETNTQKFDVVFIDGDHEHKQVQRDFRNSANFLNEGGVILFHDMLPKNRYAASSPRQKHKDAPAWNGNVWINAFELASNPDWEFFIVQIDHGVGVCYRKNNASVLEYSGRTDWDYFREHWKSLPRIHLPELQKLI